MPSPANRRVLFPLLTRPGNDETIRPGKRSARRSKTNEAKLRRPESTFSAISNLPDVPPAGAGDAAAGAATSAPAGDKGAVPAQKGCAWGDWAGTLISGGSKTVSTEMMAPAVQKSRQRPHEVQRASFIVAMPPFMEIASRLQASKQVPQPVQRFSST